jgi:hypothetical protein
MATIPVHDPFAQLEVEIVRPTAQSPIERWHARRRAEGKYELSEATKALLAERPPILSTADMEPDELVREYAWHPLLLGMDCLNRDAQIFAFLLDRGPTRATPIGEFVGRDTKSIYRTLGRLVASGDVEAVKGETPRLWRIPQNFA